MFHRRKYVEQTEALNTKIIWVDQKQHNYNIDPSEHTSNINLCCRSTTNQKPKMLSGAWSNKPRKWQCYLNRQIVAFVTLKVYDSQLWVTPILCRSWFYQFLLEEMASGLPGQYTRDLNKSHSQALGSFPLCWKVLYELLCCHKTVCSVLDRTSIVLVLYINSSTVLSITSIQVLDYLRLMAIWP